MTVAVIRGGGRERERERERGRETERETEITFLLLFLFLDFVESIRLLPPTPPHPWQQRRGAVFYRRADVRDLMDRRR